MKNVTRAVTATDLAGLLASSHVATVAWNHQGQIAAEPAAFRFASGKYVVGVAPGLLTEGQEVVVLIDDGPWYFDLRGVRVRGRLSASNGAHHQALEWFEVEPEREVAWHYGTLRER